MKNNSNTYDYDLFTIGAGSGGVRASRMSAGYGARVAVAEERYLGGTCVNVGCIPKKLLVYAAHFSEDFKDAEGFGWTIGDRQFNWATLISNKNTEIERLNGVYRKILEGSGVKIFDARAHIVDPHTVEVGGEKITAANILVATGGWPVVPDLPGKEYAITSNDAFFLEKLPRRVVIVGGGYIAVEFAGIFHGLGAEVVQLYRGPLFMRGFDIDVRRTLSTEMAKKGIEIRVNSEVTSIGKSGNVLIATLSDGATIEADFIMYATGRAPNTGKLGLEKVGVKLGSNGAVVVDDYFRTNVPSIYAIGDVTDRLKLTPVAIAEGMVLARNLFGGEPSIMDYENVPTAVFSLPPVATVGYTEEMARNRCGPVGTYKSTFRPLKHMLSGRNEKTMMKLIVERASDRVVGCHMVGPDAGEIIQGLAIALKCNATKAQFDATLGIHPTVAEEFVTMREPTGEPSAE